MKVLFAASEAVPYVKISDLGEVIGGLPKELHAAGTEAAIILPLYNVIDKKAWKLKPIFKSKTIRFSHGLKQKKIKFGLYSGHFPGSSLTVYFVENKKILGGGGISLYKATPQLHRKEVERFAFFGEAVFACLRNNLLNFSPDIVHAHDWQMGQLVAQIANGKAQMAKKRGKNQLKNIPGQAQLPKVVFTVHNISDQGILRDKNYLKEGIEKADSVTTVSRAHAEEIQTKDLGAGLHRILSKRKPLGIQSGCDYDLIKNFGGKDAAKLKFQENFRLKHGLSRPLFGMVSRLHEGKGTHLALAVAPYLVEVFDADLALSGFGEEEFENGLMRLMQRYPENVFVKIGADENLAHEIYAASDFILAPHASEPSGTRQITAMRYGAIPIARRIGSFCDIIEHNKTGVLFDGQNDKAFLGAIEEALMIFVEEEKLKKMRGLCEVADFSWKKPASAYQKLYRRVMSSA
ncbi:MAG: glycogen/starch synthase [Candidatus Liptonbacteria bacterium]|nr:glycogen/starch synthase [Candidatus Liptonbacteria bacterium]